MALSSEHPIPHFGSVAPIPSAEGKVRAAGHLFGRWPLVPSRELRRIRQILLYAASNEEAESMISLSESSRELLELVTAELKHRGQLDGPVQPAPRSSEQVRTRARKKGEHGRGRSF